MSNSKTPKRYRDLDVNRLLNESSIEPVSEHSQEKIQKAETGRLIKLRSLEPNSSEEPVDENSGNYLAEPEASSIQPKVQRRYPFIKPRFRLVKCLQEEDDAVEKLKPPQSPEKKKRYGKMFGVVLFAAGLLFFLFPPLSIWLSLWEMWRGAVPLSAVAAIILALLAMSNNIAFRFLGAGLVFSALAVAVILSFFPMSVVIPELVAVQQYLPGTGETLAAALLFMACFFLITGTGPVRYTVALTAGLLAFGMPWLALSNDVDFVKEKITLALTAPQTAKEEVATEVAKAEAHSTILAPTHLVSIADAYSISVPANWKISAGDTENQHIFSSRYGSLVLLVRHDPIDSELVFHEHIRQQLETMRQNKSENGEISIDLPGSPRRHKVTLLFEKSRSEILFIETADSRYSIAFSGSEAAFNDYRLVINKVFEGFKPHPAKPELPEKSEETAALQ